MFGEDAWAKLQTKRLLGKWTGHPEASPFTAPAPDGGLQLPYAEQVEQDKQLVSLQNTVGGMAAISTRMLGLMDEQAKVIQSSVARLRDSSVAIPNPREEAASLLSSVREALVLTWSKDVTDQTRLAAALFNKITLMRR